MPVLVSTIPALGDPIGITSSGRDVYTPKEPFVMRYMHYRYSGTREVGVRVDVGDLITSDGMFVRENYVLFDNPGITWYVDRWGEHVPVSD